jgi:hypothetical protein
MVRWGMLAAVLGALPAEAQDASSKAVADCYVARALELDDRISDARTIGDAVSFNCLAAEREYIRQGNGYFATESDLDRAVADRKPNFRAQAVTIVLMLRGQQKPKP